jgi:hypothetical protein
MTTVAHTGTIVAHALAQTGKRTMLASLTTIAVIIVAVAAAVAYGQADHAVTMLQSFLRDNRFSGADIELRILGAGFAPSILGMLLVFFALGLPDDSKQ